MASSRASQLPADAGSREAAPALELTEITKRFGHLVANDKISLKAHAGEILGLLGENGAGKTTLMDVVYGLYQPDGGEIEVAGMSVKVGSPIKAVELGIGMVHQHFVLCPDMTVAENVALGASLLPGVARIKQVSARLVELSREYGLDIRPDAIVEDLDLGARQRAEIAKALYRGAEILILDEPTAALSEEEWEQLAVLLKGLREVGKCIIFITHKLDELFSVADRCVVLRRGKVVGDIPMRDTDKQGLADLMVGREVVLERRRLQTERGEAIVRLDHVHATRGRDGRKMLDDVGLVVHAGEIVGIAGVAGNGQEELVEALVGAMPIEAGSIHIDGEDRTGFTPADFGRLGGALIPADRHTDGVALELSVVENLIARDLELSRFVKHGVLDLKGARRHCERLRSEYDIRAASLEIAIGDLSGGNQQKAVFARELSRDPRFIVVAEPTRGLDVGAAEFVYTKLNERKAAGAGIVLISSDLDEVMSLSDRIAVMVDGVLSAPLDSATATRQAIGMLMAGEGMRRRPTAAEATPAQRVGAGEKP